MAGQSWWVNVAGEALGPYTADDLVREVAAETIVPATLVARSPNGPWSAASSVKGIRFPVPPPIVKPLPPTLDMKVHRFMDSDWQHAIMILCCMFFGAMLGFSAYLRRFPPPAWWPGRRRVAEPLRAATCEAIP